MPATRPTAAARRSPASRAIAPRVAAGLTAVLVGVGAPAAPAAAQQAAAQQAAALPVAALPVAPAGGAQADAARPAHASAAALDQAGARTRRSVRLEAVAAAPDTVSMRELARGVPLMLQLVGADGQPIAAPVQWRVLAGNAAFTSVEGRSDAEGFVRATLGRAPWLLAHAGTVTVEATARARGATEKVRMSFVLARD
jgi:uncharacterized protein YjeT (DUF2065 family)